MALTWEYASESPFLPGLALPLSPLASGPAWPDAQLLSPPPALAALDEQPVDWDLPDATALLPALVPAYSAQESAALAARLEEHLQQLTQQQPQPQQQRTNPAFPPQQQVQPPPVQSPQQPPPALLASPPPPAEPVSPPRPPSPRTAEAPAPAAGSAQPQRPSLSLVSLLAPHTARRASLHSPHAHTGSSGGSTHSARTPVGLGLRQQPQQQQQQRAQSLSPVHPPSSPSLAMAPPPISGEGGPSSPYYTPLHRSAVVLRPAAVASRGHSCPQDDTSSAGSRPQSPLMPFGRTLATAASPTTSGAHSRARTASSRVPNRAPAQAAAPVAAAAAAAPAPGDPASPLQCVSCRRKKRDCDGASPCGACRKADLPCSFPPHAVVRRGPAVGVVGLLRGQLASLQEQLRTVRENTAQEKALTSSLAPMHHRAILAFLGHLHTARDQSAVQAFFCSLNNSLFPFLDRVAFMGEHSRFAVEGSVQPPLSWTFQYACCVAIGSTINGDTAYAKTATSVARIVSCALFDAPSYSAVRGFLMLSYLLIGQNQHRRASCCLAIAKRQLFLVPMFHARSITKPAPPGEDTLPEPLSTAEHVRLHEQLKLLLLFLEDMLLSSPWWKLGWSGTDELANGALAPLESHAPTLMSASPPAPSRTSSGGGLPTLFGMDDAQDSYSSTGWSDLLLQPNSFTQGPSMSPGVTTAAAAAAAVAAPAPIPSPAGKEFAYNRTSALSMRGGNVGLFDFAPPSTGSAGISAGLFEGSTPMASVHVRDVKKEVLDAYAEQKAAELSASSGYTVRTNRKRKAVQMRDDHSSAESGTLSDGRSPGRHTSLYRTLPHPASAPVSPVSRGAAGEVSMIHVRSATGRDLQLDLMRCMCTLSAIRGNVAGLREDPNAALLLHKCVSVLTEGERRLQHQQQQLSVNSSVLASLRALVACMKAVSLQLLHTIGAGDTVLPSLVLQAARQASLLTASADLSFCPFLAVFFHAVSQLHLIHARAHLPFGRGSMGTVSTASSAAAAATCKFLLLDLRYFERVASRWDFARPIFANLQQRVWSLLRGCTTLPQPLDPALMQLLYVSLPPARSSGADSNQVGGSLAEEGSSDEHAPFISASRLDFSAGGRGAATMATHMGPMRSAVLADESDLQGVLLEPSERDGGPLETADGLPARKRHANPSSRALMAAPSAAAFAYQPPAPFAFAPSAQQGSAAAAANVYGAAAAGQAQTVAAAPVSFSSLYPSRTPSSSIAAPLPPLPSPLLRVSSEDPPLWRALPVSPPPAVSRSFDLMSPTTLRMGMGGDGNRSSSGMGPTTGDGGVQMAHMQWDSMDGSGGTGSHAMGVDRTAAGLSRGDSRMWMGDGGAPLRMGSGGELGLPLAHSMGMRGESGADGSCASPTTGADTVATGADFLA